MEKKIIRLFVGFHVDLRWWISLLPWFNGTVSMIDYNFGDGSLLFTDSSLDGYGLVTRCDWQAGVYNSSFVIQGWTFYGHWCNMVKPIVCDGDDNINLLGLLPEWLGVLRLIRNYRNAHIVVLFDNAQVVNMLNFGKSSNVSCMCLLRELFWLCAFFNLYITARHISSSDNILPDRLSRVKESDSLAVIYDWYWYCSGPGCGRFGLESV